MVINATKSEMEGAPANNKKVALKPRQPFRLVEDDSKPILRDPILRSDPIDTEQAVLRLLPFAPVLPSVDVVEPRSSMRR